MCISLRLVLVAVVSVVVAVAVVLVGDTARQGGGGDAYRVLLDNEKFS